MMKVITILLVIFVVVSGFGGSTAQPTNTGKTALFAKFRNTQEKKEIDLCLTISSIDSSNRLEIPGICRRITDAFNGSGVHLGASVHSSTVALTPHFTEVLNTIDNDKQPNGEIALGDALEAAQKILTTGRSRRTAQKVAIVITDGKSNTGSDPVAVSQKLQAKGILVVVIVLGQASEGKIAEIASPGYHFHANNYDELFKILQDQSGSCSASILPKILLNKTPIRIGDNLDLELVIANNGKQDIPKGSELILSTDRNYFHEQLFYLPEAIPARSSKSVSLRLEAIPGITAKNIPGCVNIKLSTGHCSLEICAVIGTEHFIQTFKDIDPCYPKLGFRYNVLGAGTGRAGKSTFLNALETALNSQVVRPHQEGGGFGHVTVKYSVSDLMKYGIAATLRDTWGLVNGSYTPEFFRKLLQGKIKSAELNRTTNEITLEENTDPETIAMNKIHVVAMVVEHTISVDSDEIKEQKKLVDQYWRIAQDEQVSPLLFVTKLNQINEDQYESKRKEIATAFNIQPSAVRFVMLRDETLTANEKDHMIDIERMEDLQALLNQAKSTACAQVKTERDDLSQKASAAAKQISDLEKTVDKLIDGLKVTDKEGAISTEKQGALVIDDTYLGGFSRSMKSLLEVANNALKTYDIQAIKEAVQNVESALEKANSKLLEIARRITVEVEASLSVSIAKADKAFIIYEHSLTEDQRSTLTKDKAYASVQKNTLETKLTQNGTFDVIVISDALIARARLESTLRDLSSSTVTIVKNVAIAVAVILLFIFIGLRISMRTNNNTTSPITQVSSSPSQRQTSTSSKRATATATTLFFSN